MLTSSKEALEKTKEFDVVILGAGLTGLSVALTLGDHAVVLERNNRPGGLVRTDCFDGYWFDHVIHILHFQDKEIEAKIKGLLADCLAPCPPEAWVETAFGTTRFPFQMHLNGLESNQIIRCIRDLAETTFNATKSKPSNFSEILLQTFGRGMCEIFLFPYNRKVWKRPLDTLAPSGFQWNMSQPDFEKVLLGAISSNSEFLAYNSNGWYPRPAKDSPMRGMEILPFSLAKKISNLRLNHTVKAIDLEKQTVTADSNNHTSHFVFREVCCSTLPLPTLIKMCKQAPEELKRACSSLTANRVLSASLSIRGPRPVNCGHWCYYADESLIFTRLVYMHKFDPHSAPDDGWGLLVEITEPAENPPTDPNIILSRVRSDIQRIGALPAGCEIIDEHLIIVDPAYVVFTNKNEAIVEQARVFLKNHGIEPLGRYGRWEYSSMAQVMQSGFSWGESLLRLLNKDKDEESTNYNNEIKRNSNFKSVFQ